VFANIPLVYTPAPKDDVTVSNTVKAMLLFDPSSVHCLGEAADDGPLIAYFLIFFAIGNSYVNVPVLFTVPCQKVPVF